MPLIRFRIDFAENSNIGPGKIALLEAIQTQGSVSAAARVMQLSYRKAWLLLDSLNRAFTEPVSVNSVGGIGGGGVTITPFGALLIKRYRQIEQRFVEHGNRYLKDVQASVRYPDSTKLKRMRITRRARRRKAPV